MRKAAVEVLSFYESNDYFDTDIVFVDPVEHNATIQRWGDIDNSNAPAWDPDVGTDIYPALRFAAPAFMPPTLTNAQVPRTVEPAVPMNRHPGFYMSPARLGARFPTAELVSQFLYAGVFKTYKELASIPTNPDERQRQGRGRPEGMATVEDLYERMPPQWPSVAASIELRDLVLGRGIARDDPKAEALVAKGADIDMLIVEHDPMPSQMVTSKALAAIHLAARGTSVRLLKRLHKFGADMNTKDLMGRTQLHTVVATQGAQYSPEAAVRYIRRAIKFGADPNAMDRVGLSPCLEALATATSSGNPSNPLPVDAKFELYNPYNAFCSALWAGGADLDQPDYFGQSPLSYATGMQNNEFLYWALTDKKGPKLNANLLDGASNTPLLYAMESFRFVMMTARGGISLSQQRGGGQPMHYQDQRIADDLSRSFAVKLKEEQMFDEAMAFEEVDAAGVKVEHGASSTGRVTFDQISTHLEKEGRVSDQVEEMLVGCKLLPVDFDRKKAFGKSGERFGLVDYSKLFAAAEAKLAVDQAEWAKQQDGKYNYDNLHPEAPQWTGDRYQLWRDMEKVVRPKEDGTQEAPLEAAVRMGLMGAKGIAASPCGINDVNGAGTTVLLVASRSNNADMVRLLLAAGADPNVAGPLGLTALHDAASHGFSRAVRAMLQSPRIDLAQKDGRGRTAYQLAKAHGHLLVADEIRLAAEVRGVDVSLLDASAVRDKAAESEATRANVAAAAKLPASDLASLDILSLISTADLANEAKRVLGENGFHPHDSPAGSFLAGAVVDSRGQSLGSLGPFPKLSDVVAMWSGNESARAAYAEAPVDLVRAPEAWPEPKQQWADAQAQPGDAQVADEVRGPDRAEPFATLQEEWDAFVNPALQAEAARTERLRGDDTPYCEVDVIDVEDMTPELFRDHVAISRPILIKRGVNASWNLDAFRPSRFIPQFADKQLLIAGIPYGNEFGQQELQGSIAQYHEYLQDSVPDALEDFERGSSGKQAVIGELTDEEEAEGGAEASQGGVPPNIFDGWDHEKFPLYLINSAEVPFWLRNVGPASFFNSSMFQKRNWQIFGGPPLSGAPMHYHVHAINFALTGRKRWFVLPPTGAIYSSTHIHRWYQHELGPVHKTRRPLECVQEAGDAFLIPMGWAHGVLNLRYALSLAMEFSHTTEGDWRHALVSMPGEGEYQWRDDVHEYLSNRYIAGVFG